ncbi:MAG: YecA family protein [Rubrivivax sp.]
MNTTPLNDADITRLQSLLDRVPEPLEPLDAVALDGFLAGIVLQPQTVPPAQWLRWVTDLEGRALPTSYPTTELHTLVRRRHAEIERAVAERDWFDPWIFELDEDAPPSEAVLPWVAGFAAAMELFPALMAIEDPELVEPLALLYRHFDPEDLEDADALVAVIETLEPAEDLAEAVQDLVRSLMLIADVSRPLPKDDAKPGPAAKRAGAQRRGTKARRTS